MCERGRGLGVGMGALKASLFPAPSWVTLRECHGSAACRRKKTPKERSVSPNIPFVDASVSRRGWGWGEEAGKPNVAP